MTKLRWAWKFIQAMAVTMGTLYLGVKWVQNEFRVIAQDEVKQVESRLNSVRSADITHIDKRFNGLEKRFDDLSILIIERTAKPR